ncbi:MAG: hypothetical protein WB474_07795 [Nitrososphaeraceae archaeon]
MSTYGEGLCGFESSSTSWAAKNRTLHPYKWVELTEPDSNRLPFIMKAIPDSIVQLMLLFIMINAMY